MKANAAKEDGSIFIVKMFLICTRLYNYKSSFLAKNAISQPYSRSEFYFFSCFFPCFSSWPITSNSTFCRKYLSIILIFSNQTRKTKKQGQMIDRSMWELKAMKEWFTVINNEGERILYLRKFIYSTKYFLYYRKLKLTYVGRYRKKCVKIKFRN